MEEKISTEHERKKKNGREKKIARTEMFANRYGINISDDNIFFVRVVFNCLLFVWHHFSDFVSAFFWERERYLLHMDPIFASLCCRLECMCFCHSISLYYLVSELVYALCNTIIYVYIYEKATKKQQIDSDGTQNVLTTHYVCSKYSNIEVCRQKCSHMQRKRNPKCWIFRSISDIF